MGSIRIDLASPALSGHSQVKKLRMARVARALLDAVVLANRLHLRDHPNTPRLHQSGVIWIEEPQGVETFADIPTILRRGHGDCAHLAAWRVAELQEAGEAAHIRIGWKTVDGKRLFHILVRRADGRVEDPSMFLGMRRRGHRDG